MDKSSNLISLNNVAYSEIRKNPPIEIGDQKPNNFLKSDYSWTVHQVLLVYWIQRGGYAWGGKYIGLRVLLVD